MLTVTDRDSGQAVPARVTITDAKTNLAELIEAKSKLTAVRQGTLYTMGSKTRFFLAPGDYTVYATRGMEWSRGEAKLSVRPSQGGELALTIRREVGTEGFIAADTHIHTKTFSGHGDATVQERLITLAGEGVELAVATDHNHNTDYHPEQSDLRLNSFFTSVTGNEISTPIGHINGFPLDPKDSTPPHKLTDWVQLVDGIRAKGAKVVILNHPRGEVFTRYAFNNFKVNRASGEFPNTTQFPFDAMELANPGGKYEVLYILQDWFALLNHGQKVTAVAASDSHTVGDAVGWWRSYIPSSSDDPAKVDVEDACRRYLSGETSVAMGIFTDIRVANTNRMGQTYSPAETNVPARVRVAAPSWVNPRRVLMFLSGQQVAEQAVHRAVNGPTDVWMDFSVSLPSRDCYLVAAVIGDGVDYALAGTKKEKNTAFTFAVTNPVFLDVDKNGTYDSPRQIAAKLLNGIRGSIAEQWKAVMAADEVIAVQMISLLRKQTRSSDLAALDQRIREAAQQRPLIAEYAVHALPSEINQTTGEK